MTTPSLLNTTTPPNWPSNFKWKMVRSSYTNPALKR
jgi:hypothetical protein